MNIGMESCGPNPRTYSKAEYDALHAEAEALRVVAALSAQQSAPERVSVPVELLERVCWPVVSGSDRHTHSEAVTELRALLASAEGGEV